jgi:hypothetical protein
LTSWDAGHREYALEKLSQIEGVLSGKKYQFESDIVIEKVFVGEEKKLRAAFVLDRSLRLMRVSPVAWGKKIGASVSRDATEADVAELPAEWKVLDYLLGTPSRKMELSGVRCLVLPAGNCRLFVTRAQGLWGDGSWVSVQDAAQALLRMAWVDRAWLDFEGSASHLEIKNLLTDEEWAHFEQRRISLKERVELVRSIAH